CHEAAACPCQGQRKVDRVLRANSLLLLVFLRYRSADDIGHVGTVLLLSLEEGLVFFGGRRLFVAFDGRERIVSVDLRRVLGLDGFGRIHGLLGRLARGPFRRRGRRRGEGRSLDPVDGLAYGTRDRITVEVVEAGAALWILAGALGSAFRFGGH